MTTVHLSGSITHQTSTKARGRLLDKLSREDSLRIDLSGVTEIDSSGLAILVEVYLAARKMGHQIDLINVGRDVRKKICLAHLDGIFTPHGIDENHTIH